MFLLGYLSKTTTLRRSGPIAKCFSFASILEKNAPLSEMIGGARRWGHFIRADVLASFMGQLGVNFQSLSAFLSFSLKLSLSL